MKVIVSDASRKMVYHRGGCIYAARIKSAHRMTLKMNDAVRHGYHECSCCSGMKGAVRVSRKALNQVGQDIAFEYLYDDKSDTLFIRTEFGFWKIYQKESGFVLYHCSRYDRTKTFEALMHDVFHRQSDVPAYESLLKHVNYIVEHDRAKRIILEDYKKLPQRTKKQKKYYKKAEQRARRLQIMRVDMLLDSLKTGKPLKQLA